jgi:iron complex outermembrane receptor protein
MAIVPVSVVMPRLAAAVVLIAEPASADAADNIESSRVPNIVVTAQMREQHLLDVPISIAAFDPAKLDAFQINELRDFVAQIPNVTINNFPARPDTLRIFIRGIGQNDVSLTQDPSVGLYVDGVYVGTTVGAAFETEDIERIEVLRGPQGSLYGRNTTGGTVNIITAKPGLDGLHARASLGSGNFDERRMTLMLNAPLGGRLAVRLNGLRRKRDGLQRNTGLGRDFAEVDHTALRAALRYQPVDALTIDYAFEHSRNRDSNTLTVPTLGTPLSFPLAPPFSVPGTFGGATALTSLVNSFSVVSPFSSKRPRSARALRPVLRNDGKIASHTLTFDLVAGDNFNLQSITGHRRIANFQSADNLPVHEASIVTSVIASTVPQLPVGTVLDAIGPNGAAYMIDDIRFRSMSQEIRAIGRIAGRHDYVLGAYYYEDRASQDVIGGAIGSGSLILPNFTTIRNRSYAAFGEVAFRPAGDRFSVALGGRYSHDRRIATRINERSFSFAALGGFTADNCSFFALTFQALGQTCNATGQVASAAYKNSFNNFSPSITLAYKANDDLNFYTKHARGYKSGGTSQRSANPANFAAGFLPERVSSFEAGLKGRFFDHRLSASLAGFHIRLNDLQASVQTGATAGDRDFIGIDGSKIYGVEFDLVASFSRALSVGVSGALLRARIGERSASVLLDTGATQVQNFVADQTSAPKRSFAANVDFRQPLVGRWAFGFHANLGYQSAAETSTNLLDNRTIPGRALVDAQLSLSRTFGEDREIAMRLWGKNIFDKIYRTVNFGAFAFSGADTVSEFGEPATYGVTLSLRY